MEFSRRRAAFAVEAQASTFRYASNNRMRTLHHPRIDEIALPDVLHALSDPVRLQIVRALADREEQSCSSVEASVSKSTLSHHFKVLREAGVTHTRVNGTHRLVSIRRDELEERFPGLLDSVLGASRVETAQAV
jgi:DNA-binding transcriptional ArsR family regulator